ncbi:MAG: sulfate ABC transporter ATP-binding protein [Phycisphaerae bacterium]|nr:sulfate ABC transporter ATP-binding protein [Phycisphaerae bacterium]
MSIEVRNISKTFGTFAALKNVSLTIHNSELVALLGPSGCGKTTLLRIIAGLETADPGSGPVLFHEDDVSNQSVRQRRVGFVFQHYSLFRHMNIFENVAFGLKVRPRKSRPDKTEIKDRVHKLLKLVQLEHQARMYPNQLSGGQRQRVALARSLAVEPKILLLDEPFGALDAKVRKELRVWLRRLHDEMSITSVFVTHDQEEALEVADRVALLNAGQVEQVGTPEQVYDNPANPFVFNFLGNVNIFHCRTQDSLAHVKDHESFLSAPGDVAESQKKAYVRPHDIEIMRTPGKEAISAKVIHVTPVGPVVKIQLARQDTNEVVEAEMTRQIYDQLMLRTGELVFIQLTNPRYF